MKKENISSKLIFVFDAFGTLFKTSEIDSELQNIAKDKTEKLLFIWRKKQLEYTWLRNQMNEYAPFSQVTKEALDYSMRVNHLKNPRIFDLLLPIYDSPNLIKGVRDALDFFQEKTICILSNGTRSMLENGIQKTGIEHHVNHIFSVDDIGIYKPRKEVYQMVLDQLNTSKDEVLFFSSNQWDVSGASNFGLDSVWVNRNNEIKEGLPFGKVLEINNLNELKDYLA
ncbi:MAG: haloacid dehalogenase type II [Saprospiraceae bacterium]